MLGGVADEAESLRKQLEEPAFQKASRDLGANLLTVVKLNEHEIRFGVTTEDSDKKADSGVMSHLVDAENNQYTLSKPKDSTVRLKKA